MLRISPDGKTVEVYIEEPTAHLFAHPTNIAFDGAALYTANLGRWHITRIDTDTTGTPLWQRVAEARGTDAQAGVRATMNDHRAKAMTEKALSDVTVLDFSHLLQGPFATQLLADMGANVIKVERPGQGDLFRTMTFNNRWVGGTREPELPRLEPQQALARAST